MYLHHRCLSVASGPKVPSGSSVTVPSGYGASKVDWTEQDAISQEDEPVTALSPNTTSN